MPGDFKRIPCPQETFQPQLYCKSSTKKQLLQENGKRADNRSLDEIRPIFLKAGVVSQARGSAYIEACNTKVICAVYGPHEVQRREGFSMQGSLRCEFKYATFSCPGRRQHQTDSEEKQMGLVIAQALQPAICLHKFPKSQLDIFVTVLQNDGSAFAAALTCASVAVADAGIEMYDVVIGCSLRQAGETTSVLDPTITEDFYSRSVDGDASNHGSVTAAYLPSLNQLSAIQQTGEIEPEVAAKCLQKCIEGSVRIFPVVSQCLIKATKRKAQKSQQTAKKDDV
ncbi:exosome complex component MTR3-like [Patiria miniata]|uniref:Exosome complex component MTR3 n=1 Tax=Patiria miniata TaxID=46514 RepID=A0A913ZLY2_PATMI|nr:exosome complex component MTR3-like [Patiria miniata]XP_038052111.1 exosome complex component MTR3-like [Patiria miniata]